MRLLVPLLPLLLLVVGAAPSPPLQDAGSQLITLRAHDSVTAAWDDRPGAYVTALADGELDLSRATLAFGILEEGKLSFGFRVRERANLVDVGDFRVKPLIRPRDIVPKPPVGAIHTLRVVRNNVQYMAPVGRWLELKEASPLFARLGSEGVQHVTPEVGHLYLLRYVVDGGERIVAFQVVEHVPNVKIVIRAKVLASS